MKTEKDQLVRQSKQQSNPYTAQASDFEVGRADEFSNANVPGHGQCGANEKEYGQLLKAADAPGVNKSSFGAKRSPATEASDADQSHTGRDTE